MPPAGNRQSFPPEEEALPKGHPCRPDYDPDSEDAKQWHHNQLALEHRDGLPPNYQFDPLKPHGALVWRDGVDPLHPEREPYTGRVHKAAAAPEAPEPTAQA